MSRVMCWPMPKTVRELQREAAVQERLIEDLRTTLDQARGNAESLAKRVEELQAKVADLSKKGESQSKTVLNLIERRNAMRSHVRLAITSCARGRQRRGKRVRTLKQVQAMLEAGIDEDDHLAWAAEPWGSSWGSWARIISPYMIMGALGYSVWAGAK